MKTEFPGWDKAPEGAIAWTPESNYYHACWWNDNNEIMIDDGIDSKWNRARRYLRKIPSAVHRVKSERNGEGLPPVGTEVKYPSGAGVVVLPADRNGVITAMENGKYKRVTAIACESIRTEEDKVVEEMEVVYRNCGGISISDGMRALYRAGYRKQ